jgi:hypothetical protein
VGVLGAVGLAEEEDLPGELLTHLAGQVGRAEPTVEAGHVGVGLAEAGMLAAGQRQVADDVQAVAPAGGPPRHQADHHLGHEPDEPLDLEDVEAAGAGRVDRGDRVALGVAVAVAAADALVAARAEGPDAVLGRRAVAGEQHAADVRALAGVVERPVQLVDRVGPEGVADLGPVERDAHGTHVEGPVVGDVGQVVEARHRGPGVGVEQGGDHRRRSSRRRPARRNARGG